MDCPNVAGLDRPKMTEREDFRRAYEAANTVYQTLSQSEMDVDKNTVVPYDVCVETLDRLAFTVIPVLFDAMEDGR